jgi:predicted TIM-barrel fold metal-dependent hydrolase
MPYQTISADSHFVEPPEIWTERIAKEFRDRAPRLMREYQGAKGDFLVCEDLGVPLTQFAGAGKSGQELLEHAAGGLAALPKSVWDPAERLKEQDLDGVNGEVLYASCGMMLFAIQDAQLRAAAFGAFNDWAAEYTRTCPQRLIGTGLITLEDIPAAVAELQRCAQEGLRGVMIQGAAPEDRPYSGRAYDPFWAAAQDLNLPISLHVFTARRSEFDATKALQTYIQGPHYIQLTLADMVLGGVFERFPRLNLVSAENDIAWLPHFLYRMDHGYDKFRKFAGVDLKLMPSEYMKRQVYATFVFEDAWIDMRQRFSLSNLMWSSDYPHADSTWPRSQQYIAEHFQGVAGDVLTKILSGNVSRVYGMT